MSQKTGTERSLHILGAHIGEDEVLGAELPRAIIETASGNIIMDLYNPKDAVIGMKLNPDSLMFKITFLGRDKKRYFLVKGKPL